MSGGQGTHRPPGTKWNPGRQPTQSATRSVKIVQGKVQNATRSVKIVQGKVQNATRSVKIVQGTKWNPGRQPTQNATRSVKIVQGKLQNATRSVKIVQGKLHYMKCHVVCSLTRPAGSSKYSTTRKNTQRYYTSKRLIRYIYLYSFRALFVLCLVQLDNK